MQFVHFAVFNVFGLYSLMLQGELARLSEIKNSLAIFCMATYGEGDPTDNAQDFYDWLQENDDEDLSGLNYTVRFFCFLAFLFFVQISFFFFFF